MAQRRRSMRLSLDSGYSCSSPTLKRRKVYHSPSRLGLDDLPDELMVIVLEATVTFLRLGPPPGYFKALRSLCLTSRRYHRLAKPFLYLCVDNRCVISAKILKVFANQQPIRGNVKFLTWVDDKSFDEILSRHDMNYKLCLTERRELCKATDNIGLRYMQARHIYRAITRQSPDDLLSLLLLLSPDVEALEVADCNLNRHPRGYWDSPLWLKVLKQPVYGGLQPFQHFQRLSHIVIRMSPIRLDTIVPLLHLPALKKLALADALHSGDLDPYVLRSTRTSALEQLSFETSIVDSTAICQILDMIVGLKDFRVDFDNPLSRFEEMLDPADFPDFYYHDLRAALVHHQDTLQKLRILDFQPLDCVEYDDEDGNTNVLGSLKDMHHVREVEVGLRALRDPSEVRPFDHANLRDNLPPNIETLWIYVEEFTDEFAWDEAKWWKLSLRDLANNCKTNYPHLKLIIVSDEPVGALPVDDVVRKLKSLFKEKGVDLVIKGEHLEAPIPALRSWKKLTADRRIALQSLESTSLTARLSCSL